MMRLFARALAAHAKDASSAGRIVLPLLLLMIGGCSGRQSALAPAGEGARQLADLFWWMTAGAALIWLIVIGLAAYAIYLRPSAHPRRQSAILIIGGGTLLPTIVLTALLAYGLSLLPNLTAPAPPGSLRITVIGEQWWWRIRYERPEGEVVELGNEIHLPVGEPVQFTLQSADVIHSFWIPPLGGKMDMFPGRTTQLALRPTDIGIYRGACAEYCGGSHALMNFDVVVESRGDFDRWIEHQAAPASEPASEEGGKGRRLFLANGCGACHVVRGVSAAGSVGPDLTHVGSRLTVAAGVLSNEIESFHKWVESTDAIKPEVIMPAFPMLSDDELKAIATYLDELK